MVRNYLGNTGTASVLIIVGAAMVLIPEPATSALGLVALVIGVILYFYR